MKAATNKKKSLKSEVENLGNKEHKEAKKKSFVRTGEDLSRRELNPGLKRDKLAY